MENITNSDLEYLEELRKKLIPIKDYNFLTTEYMRGSEICLAYTLLSTLIGTLTSIMKRTENNDKTK